MPSCLAVYSGRSSPDEACRRSSVSAHRPGLGYSIKSTADYWRVISQTPRPKFYAIVPKAGAEVRRKEV